MYSGSMKMCVPTFQYVLWHYVLYSVMRMGYSTSAAACSLFGQNARSMTWLDLWWSMSFLPWAWWVAGLLPHTDPAGRPGPKQDMAGATAPGTDHWNLETWPRWAAATNIPRETSVLAQGGRHSQSSSPRPTSPGGGRGSEPVTAGKAYLPGTGDTVIHKAVPHGRGPSIALRSGWPHRLPQMWATRVRNFC